MSPTAVDRLAEALRSRILSGDLHPGFPLREEALSTEYGLGRHTVRAALRQLSAERLVSIQPFSGARVTLLDDDDVRALMQLRSALEGEAVRLLNRQASAARNADSAVVGGADSAAFAEALASIHAANAELRRACIETPDDRTRIETTHAALHHAIVKAANSARITDAHARLEAESILFLAQLRDVLDADEMIRQHDALVAALLVDGEAAVHAHLERAADQLISARAATRAATRAAARAPQP